MKSLETKFAEAMDAIRKAGRTKRFEEASKNCTTIETKLNCAEAVLKDVGVVRESQPIRKHNGATDNIVEGNPFGPSLEEWRESANNYSAGYIKETIDPCAKGDKVLADGLLTLGKITEAEHRKLTGEKPAGYTQLSEKERKEYDFCRAIGITEADSFRVVKGTRGGIFKEVSR